jgi:hypothetical protein
VVYPTRYYVRLLKVTGAEDVKRIDTTIEFPECRTSDRSWLDSLA